MDDKFALQALSVNAWQGSRQVLCGIELGIVNAQWTCVVGPNGAGKTSLLKSLAGLLPCQGEVRLFNRNLTDYAADERARQLAWLSQHDMATDDISVYDLVMLGRLPHQQGWRAPSALDHAVVQQCLQSMKLTDWQDRFLGSLSAGERQRVLLARALAVQAPLLLMDEPIANVDVPNLVEWHAMVRSMTTAGHTVVSVLHDLNLAMRADSVVVMHQGQIQMQASPHDLALHDCLQTVFDHSLVFHQLDDRWVVLPR